MLKRLALTATLLLAACIGPAATTPAPPPYTDLSQAFVAFHDRTQSLDPDARLAAFKTELAPLFPGFYAPRDGATQEKWDERAKKHLAGFGEIRDRYVAAQREFPAAYAGAKAHFARFFPGSKAALPTYFLHSLGEMDGGTRKIGGRDVMVFGADGIARYHTAGDLGPFFDHELFHVEHGVHFAECEPVWCSLWIEGLATAAAEQMNPGISQAALMLDIPRPIAPEVDAAWRDALCEVSGKLDSTARDDYRGLFLGGVAAQRFPPRWGYYVGYRLAKRALTKHSLQSLAYMGPQQAGPIVRAEMAEMVRSAGRCS